MADILHRIQINSSPDKIYQAILTANGLSNWWTKEVRTISQLRSIAEFGFGTSVTKMSIDKLMTEVNEQERIAGYKALNVESSEKSWAIPLLQGITTVAYSAALEPTLFDNGYVLPVEMKYK